MIEIDLLPTSPCIPDVMGSGSWAPQDDGVDPHPLAYDVGGEFYYIDDPSDSAGLVWPDEFSGAQSIEVTFSNFGTNFTDELGGAGTCNDDIGIECRRVTDELVSDGLGIYFHRYADALDPETWEWWIDYESEGATIHSNESDPRWAVWPYGETFRLRLESDVDGAYRVYVDDALLTSGTVTSQPTGATKFGIYCESDNADYADPDRVPHFAEICLQGEV